MKKKFVNPAIKVYPLELNENLLTGSTSGEPTSSDPTTNNELGNKTQLVGRQNRISNDNEPDYLFKTNL